MWQLEIQYLATVLFFCAVLHTFLVGNFNQLAQRYPRGSFKQGLFHFFGEVEVVFAIWAGLFMALFAISNGWQEALKYQNSLQFLEPFFIFVIMVVCSTRPILFGARKLVQGVSSIVQAALKTPAAVTDIFFVLILGPISGSFITEPAAMTVTAMLLNSLLEKKSEKLLYALIAVLFVNVSIGGGLTPYAAPPILMVAGRWGWDLSFVISHFGWKCLIAVVLNSGFLVLLFRKKIQDCCTTLDIVDRRLSGSQTTIPWQIILLHVFFLAGIVATSHHQNAFMGLFLLFLGTAAVTQRYHDALRLRESLLVATFLGGIIEFGEFQRWWLEPLLSRLSEGSLFLGALALTSITDNAALTFLGSQVAGLSEGSKFSLVAGAIAGGGVTLIANAPNAAGYSILRAQFVNGMKPVYLALAAIMPTMIAVICLWVL